MFKGFKLKEILPTVGGIAGYGVAGPTGAALGSGIGSIAAGKSMEDAAVNAALGYGAGQGVKFLGGGNFLSNIPGVGDKLQSFAKTGGEKSVMDFFGGGGGQGEGLFSKDTVEDKVTKAVQNRKNYIATLEDLSKADKEYAIDLYTKLTEGGLTSKETSNSLLNLRNVLGLTAFTTLFGSALAGDMPDESGPSQYTQVTTDDVLSGFSSPTPITTAANGGLMTLKDGGFPRKNGKIAGPGTETSDDIPAMLSDGEFVVNARTVRGLGKAMGGEDKMDSRERGASFLYSLQDKYGGKA